MMRDEILITVCTAVCCGLWLHCCCVLCVFYVVFPCERKNHHARQEGGSKDLEGEYVGGVAIFRKDNTVL